METVLSLDNGLMNVYHFSFVEQKIVIKESLLCDERTVTYRAMNIVEQDIRVTPGNQNFCLDACIAELQMNVKVKSRYGYSVEIERQKSYITSFEAATGMSE